MKHPCDGAAGPEHLARLFRAADEDVAAEEREEGGERAALAADALFDLGQIKRLGAVSEEARQRFFLAASDVYDLPRCHDHIESEEIGWEDVALLPQNRHARLTTVAPVAKFPCRTRYYPASQ